MIKVTKDNIQVEPLRDSVWTPHCGAVVTFEGVVRNHDEGREIHSIYYEAYESMAEKELSKIVKEAMAEWKDTRIAVVHRTGKLKVGEISIAVVTAAPHRREAFAAGRYVIDQVKERAPIWKKQEDTSSEL